MTTSKLDLSWNDPPSLPSDQGNSPTRSWGHSTHHGSRPRSPGSSGARTSESRTLAPAASLHPPAPLDLRRAPVRPSETDLSSDLGDWAKRGFHWSECAVGGPRRSCALGRERSVSLSCPTNRSNLRAMPYLRKMMGATAIGLVRDRCRFQPRAPRRSGPASTNAFTGVEWGSLRLFDYACVRVRARMSSESRAGSAAAPRPRPPEVLGGVG